jgi:SSS family solute:Na+ symporter
MTWIDYIIFALYFLGVLGIGLYFFRKNESREDYYVGGRRISATHVGMSIVATDVGGGFSIGLGGLGFAMGLSGSWLLFTGLVGAWLCAVVMVPRIKGLDVEHGLLTYPDFLRLRYGKAVAAVAAVISGVGYLGFTSAQVLAGAKLAAGSVFANVTWADPLKISLYLMAGVILIYTVLGGLKAVIYTDTLQWIILLAGLSLFGLPFAYREVGGWTALSESLPQAHFRLNNVSWVRIVNWFVTIIPIWFVAMTLYQRIFACRGVKEAKRAFFIAGLLEYPVMAFLGVTLGMMARVVFPQAEAEMAMPMLLGEALPAGIAGIVIAAYFSAIMSTADSCLIASSANWVNDIIGQFGLRLSARRFMLLSQGVTLMVGVSALLLASAFDTVLDLILHAYAFMVSGLLVPTLGAYFWKRSRPEAALVSMLGGGGLTLYLTFAEQQLPWGLDPSLFGIGLSLALFVGVSVVCHQRTSQGPDAIEKLGKSLIQHGKESDRIYLMKLDPSDLPTIVEQMERLAEAEDYGKLFCKVPSSAAGAFAEAGYREEARIPKFFDGRTDVAFMSRFRQDTRGRLSDAQRMAIERALEIGQRERGSAAVRLPANYRIRHLRAEDAAQLAGLYRDVFPSYPFPILDEDYLRETMARHIRYYGAFADGRLVAASSAETDPEARNAEMTDFATALDHRRKGLATQLLLAMESDMRERRFATLYTIARAVSIGMNVTFARCGYQFGGTLINNTQISGGIESMNVWHKHLVFSD